ESRETCRNVFSCEVRRVAGRDFEYRPQAPRLDDGAGTIGHPVTNDAATPRVRRGAASDLTAYQVDWKLHDDAVLPHTRKHSPTRVRREPPEQLAQADAAV